MGVQEAINPWNKRVWTDIYRPSLAPLSSPYTLKLALKSMLPGKHYMYTHTAAGYLTPTC